MSEAATAFANYIAKLERRGAFAGEARAALLGVPVRIRHFGAYQDIVREGERPQESCFVESGLVSRYRTLPNGSRQIVSFHLPGDMVDLQSALVIVADHGIRTHVPTVILMIAHDDILRIAAEHPSVGRAFWFDTLVDAAIFREWTVNVGRRNTRERTAHLLLEFNARFAAIGMVRDGWFDLPVTQNDLADALGITPVHMNRTMQWLRGERLIRTHSRAVLIEDMAGMVALAGFDPVYLHPEGPRSAPDGV
ncbi:Crp/Fnr family transcriptional regulator [Sphingomonadaceae bacterium G21617-S1]|jgi:CRP-like cAMP-binding protein|nr:Crp/Fnr family transcriptional regulator [Sphingomonadaceae bacterium G21617-S1]